MKTTMYKVGYASVAFFLASSIALAQEVMPESAFRSMTEVLPEGLKVPTVVEVPFVSSEFAHRESFLVRDMTVPRWVPSYYKSEFAAVFPVPGSDIPPALGALENLFDNDPRTFAEFGLPDDVNGEVTFTFADERPFTASAIRLDLADAVALPMSVSVTADLGLDRPFYEVVRNVKPTGSRVAFPPTAAKAWTITLEYAQPLRLSELRLEYIPESHQTGGLRFLAVPGHAYRVYFDADRSVDVTLPESGDLWADTGVRFVSWQSASENPLYRPADVDEDGVPDRSDNCVHEKNADQTDIDQNGRGDTCDDFDRDGIMNKTDNCPDDPNYAQTDIDADEKGDACDTEESRFTEAHKWVPWAGMGAAALVLLVLVALTVQSGASVENGHDRSR